MIACALIPRLALVAALGERRREMLGRPVALAPEPGGPQVVGEASGAAEAFGVRAGMRLAEALARCPSVALISPDPARAEAIWERILRRLEAIGAEVEPGRPGEAFFDTEPLRGVWGDAEAVLARARRALEPTARLAAGPSRLIAYAAARRARARRSPPVLGERAARRFLAGLEVGILREALAWPVKDRERRAWDHAAPGRAVEEAACLDALERLGVRTLGEFAALPAEAVADRFGESGLRALRIARGAHEPLRPRGPHEDLVERLELPEAASGPQLERALGLLTDRLLAHPARRGRTLRRLALEARLAGGGGWRSDVTLRTASTRAERIRLVLAPKLAELPGPAAMLGVRALELGPPDGDQRPLARSPAEQRRAQLSEAVRQARAAAGRDAVLQVIEVDPGSRVPERRVILTPFPELR
jgi:protein ImuB